MDYKNPREVVAQMIQSGNTKLKLSNLDLFIRGSLSGMLLGIGTSLAVTGSVQTGIGLVGALLFPVCFVIVVLMGLELVTGSFAILPIAYFRKGQGLPRLIKNLAIVYFSNLFGSLLYACLYWLSATNFGQSEPTAVADAILKIAEQKTIGYGALGAAGVATAFTKGILCNWMVSMAVVLAMCSSGTTGKIIGAWIPIFMFFAQGFEHAVVNMFVIPAGMLFGAKVSLGDWWFFNQIPVTAGNIVGAVVFTAGALYLTYGRKKPSEKIAEELIVNTEIAAGAKVA
ncbi:formate/nitrite transporter family protein [Niabella terrae]